MAASSPSARASRGRRAPRATGDDRERAILATLEELLEDRPLHAISVDDLARGAGISRPSFYFYFASKEAVLLSLFDRILAEGRAGQGDAIERLADDPPAQLRQGILAFFETFRAHRAVTLAGAEARTTSAELRAMWSRVMEAWVDEVATAISSERARGAAPSGVAARDLATALVCMNERVLHTTFAGDSPSVGEDDVVDVLVAIWLRAIYGDA
ncbi:MAG TPA: TetR/AcrR family transcriptional regulator [Solirubrobacteraceae bacterium]|nr:TetR/AcrR family transcriptional regulator [Solirubrobacteraceae bacterium]